MPILSEGALLECTMGLAPMPMNVLPLGLVFGDFLPLANIESNIPFLNITPFIMCKSPANPEVAAIIAASMGTITMGPCLPMTLAPWTPGNPTVIIGGLPCITDDSILFCEWGGEISPIIPGQMQVMA